MNTTNKDYENQKSKKEIKNQGFLFQFFIISVCSRYIPSYSVQGIGTYSCHILSFENQGFLGSMPSSFT